MVGAPKCCLRIKGRYYSCWGLWTSSYHSAGALIAPHPHPHRSSVDNSLLRQLQPHRAERGTLSGVTRTKEKQRGSTGPAREAAAPRSPAKKREVQMPRRYSLPPPRHDIDKRSVLKSRRARLWWIVIYIRMCCQVAASRVSLRLPVIP